MWYLIESKSIKIFISDKLVKKNPELATNLSADIVCSYLNLSYWEFEHQLKAQNLELLSAFKYEVPISEILNGLYHGQEGVVGFMLQVSGRLNATNTFFIHKNEDLFVTKELSNNFLRRPIVNQVVLVGTYLVPALSAHLNAGRVDKFEELFFRAIERVFSTYGCLDDPKKLSSEAIDCIPKNIIITKNGIEMFDVEYQPDISLTKSHYLFRCALGFSKQHVRQGHWPYNSPNELYLIFCRHFDILPDIQTDIESEITFRRTILPDGSAGLNYKEIHDGFFNKTCILKKIQRYFTHRISLAIHNGKFNRFLNR